MILTHPDIIEYRFMLKGMCDGDIPSEFTFKCMLFTEETKDLDADVMFLSTPDALLKGERYVFLNTGGIFSYFNGPSIMKTVGDYGTVYVRKGDSISYFYGTMLMKDTTFKIGEGEPSIIEPGRILEKYSPNTERLDLYGKWGENSDYLPMPLYSGIIKEELRAVKGLVEKAVFSSIKYSLDNFSEVAESIYMGEQTSAHNASKMIILQYVNKRTLQMEEDEREAIRFLGRMMEDNGYAVPEPTF